MPSWFWRDMNVNGRIERRAVIEDGASGIKLVLTKEDLEFLLDLGKWEPQDDKGVMVGKLVRG